MENSYCGLRCSGCSYKTAGKCSGCKPEVENKYLADVGRAIRISKLREEALKEGLDVSDIRDEISDDSYVAPVKEVDPATRYSTYCPIAICCKNNNYEGCTDCNKRISCYDYNCKGKMSSIIETKLDLWGVTTHGLKESVNYQRLLLICYIFLLVPDILTKLTSSTIVTLIYIPITGLTMFGYIKMVPYSPIFRVTVLLTTGDLLVRFLVDIIDYGTLVNGALSVFGMLVAVVNYKITFDAYADMVSEVDDVLERKWLRIWPLTIIVYVIGALIVLSSKVLALGLIPFALLDLIIIIYMIKTIKVSKIN